LHRNHHAFSKIIVRMCHPASSQAAAPGPQTQPTTPPPDCIPSDAISRTAYQYAAEHVHHTILNHSVRVYLYAQAIAERERSPWALGDRVHLLFAASILHDIGTTTAHDGPERFEVEGADWAKTFLLSNGIDEANAHEVWIAIACHTSPGIGERITELARLVRSGVTVDFKRPAAMSLTTDDEVREVERRFERGEIEKVLGDAVVEQGLRRPEKAPAASWPGVLVRSARENPGWEGVNKAF
jgi:hypothetical protein